MKNEGYGSRSDGSFLNSKKLPENARVLVMNYAIQKNQGGIATGKIKEEGGVYYHGINLEVSADSEPEPRYSFRWIREEDISKGFPPSRHA